MIGYYNIYTTYTKKRCFFKKIKITRLFSKVTKLTEQGMAKKEDKTRMTVGI